MRVGAWAGWLMALSCCGAASWAQTPDAPAPAAQSKAPPCVVAEAGKPAPAKPCAAPDHAPSVSEQFPYPGEKPVVPAAPDAPAAGANAPRPTPAQQFPFPGSSSDAVPAVKPAAKTGGVADQFPYPGETKNSPDAAPETPDFKPFEPSAPLPPAPGASSSSGSSSSSGADALPDPDAKPPLQDAGSEGQVTSRRRRLRPPAQKLQTDDERVDEDLSVAKFYQQSGNLMGAYLRAKDAVKTQPDYANAHLELAQVAEKLNKKDEAVAEYKSYLALEPDGEHVKTAQLALSRLAH